MRLDVSPEAEQDLIQAIDWYAEKEQGLGDRLGQAYRNLADRILAYPESGGELALGCRAAFIKGFPYALVYSASSEAILIHAVWHTSRSPDALRRRLDANDE